MAHCVGNQCIHCSVESCQFHARDNMCSLTDIKVAPSASCCSGKPEESLCSSYKCKE